MYFNGKIKYLPASLWKSDEINSRVQISYIFIYIFSHFSNCVNFNSTTNIKYMEILSNFYMCVFHCFTKVLFRNILIRSLQSINFWESFNNYIYKHTSSRSNNDKVNIYKDKINFHLYPTTHLIINFQYALRISK